jgi:hypothetical protein
MGGYRSLVRLELTASCAKQPSIDALLGCDLPHVQHLSLAQFVRPTQGAAISFSKCPALTTLVILACTLHGGIRWDTLRGVEHLQMRRCRGVNCIDLIDMYALHTLVFESLCTFDEDCCLTAAPKPSLLSHVHLCGIEVHPQVISTWESLRYMEFVDCAYDQTLSDIYTAALSIHPSVVCLVGYTEQGLMADEEAEDLFHHVVALSKQPTDCIRRNDTQMSLVYGSAVFDGVRGVRLCSDA